VPITKEKKNGRKKVCVKKQKKTDHLGKTNMRERHRLLHSMGIGTEQLEAGGRKRRRKEKGFPLNLSTILEQDEG